MVLSQHLQQHVVAMLTGMKCFKFRDFSQIGFDLSENKSENSGVTRVQVSAALILKASQQILGKCSVSNSLVKSLWSPFMVFLVEGWS